MTEAVSTPPGLPNDSERADIRALLAENTRLSEIVEAARRYVQARAAFNEKRYKDRADARIILDASWEQLVKAVE